ncbi:MAG: tetratricopeptide repeat protein [Microcoleaceae cyanobacterium MO_207.B10]|nr:tetratricopeptide repeat protein [Microcoleaceae cyanobacterium MO_207.B10]
MKEIKEVATALEQKNYKQAAKLLKQLQKQHPQNPWIQLYIGRWYEEIDKLESAEKFYRKLLKNANNPQVVVQARQGLQRIETIEKNRQQQAIAVAKSDPKNTEPGLLIIEPVSQENKSETAQSLARIMKIDPYTARMQLHSRGWRIYRLGTIGELKIYCQQMIKVGIPTFWAKISDIEKIHIFRVQYFQSTFPQATIVCLNEENQMGNLNFDWSEVVAQVEGLLPIFMKAMDYDPRRRSQKIRHKEMTQDYANILDLHLPGRRSIIRFCDQNYQYQKGITLSTQTEEQPLSISQTTTNRTKWNDLVNIINQKLGKVKTWSDFTPFGETVSRDYTQLLSRIKSYVDISRKTETSWDSAFQLYSTLVFLRTKT